MWPITHGLALPQWWLVCRMGVCSTMQKLTTRHPSAASVPDIVIHYHCSPLETTALFERSSGKTIMICQYRLGTQRKWIEKRLRTVGQRIFQPPASKLSAVCHNRTSRSAPENPLRAGITALSINQSWQLSNADLQPSRDRLHLQGGRRPSAPLPPSQPDHGLLQLECATQKQRQQQQQHGERRQNQQG
jgi:hypothetical protein